jgi:hypothetical protein
MQEKNGYQLNKSAFVSRMFAILIVSLMLGSTFAGIVSAFTQPPLKPPAKSDERSAMSFEPSDAVPVQASDPNLTAYWSFDENAGSMAYDVVDDKVN